MDTVTPPPLPPKDEATKELWRAVIVIYRKVCFAGRKEVQARAASVGAVMQLQPDLTWEEAFLISRDAVAWASSAHSAWLWGRKS